MGSIVLDRTDVVVGVDTHKHEHTAVAVDGLGGRLDEMAVPANNDGYAALLEWATQLGAVHAWGVEGTGSYGSGLARFLRRNGARVIEVARPPRKGERRASGKSDAIDAEHAARQVLSGDATAIPKLSEGQIESIRLLKVARDTAVKAQSQAIIALRATLVTASDELRSQLESLSEHQFIVACANLEATADNLADPDVAMRHTLQSLARRWLDLHEEIKTHTRALKQLTTSAAPHLVAAFGVGFDTAAAEVAVNDKDRQSHGNSLRHFRQGLRHPGWSPGDDHRPYLAAMGGPHRHHQHPSRHRKVGRRARRRPKRRRCPVRRAPCHYQNP